MNNKGQRATSPFSTNHLAPKRAPARAISTFPLSQSQKDLLLKNGFLTHYDLEGLKPSVLAKELKIDAYAALEIIRIVASPQSPTATQPLNLQTSTTISSSPATNNANSQNKSNNVNQNNSPNIESQNNNNLNNSSNNSNNNLNNNNLNNNNNNNPNNNNLNGINNSNSKNNLNSSPSNLANINETHTKPKIQYKSALDMLKTESQYIVTYSEEVDDLLGGGIPTGVLTEIAGVPGIGKTQFGFQTAISVSLPNFCGIEGECIYIDTEGSFMVKRVKKMAEAVAQHMWGIASSPEDKQHLEELNYSADHILSKIHYYRVHDYIEQIALINILPSILEDKPKVKLIVLDSVAFHFRYDFEDISLRSRLLNNIAQTLTYLARRHDIAVLVINQMTTKVHNNSSAASELVPALGDSWAHVCPNRLLLVWSGSHREARLIKSSSRKAGSAQFLITAEGVRSLSSQNKEM